MNHNTGVTMYFIVSMLNQETNQSHNKHKCDDISIQSDCVNTDRRGWDVASSWRAKAGTSPHAINSLPSSRSWAPDTCPNTDVE